MYHSLTTLLAPCSSGHPSSHNEPESC